MDQARRQTGFSYLYDFGRSVDADRQGTNFGGHPEGGTAPPGWDGGSSWETTNPGQLLSLPALLKMWRALWRRMGIRYRPIKRRRSLCEYFELYENGITDPDGLRLDVMADSLWASSHPSCATQILTPVQIGDIIIT